MPIKVLYRKSCFYLFFSKWWAVVLLLRCIKTFCLDEDLKELFIYLSCNLFSSFNCVNLCQVRISYHVQHAFKLFTQILCLKKKWPDFDDVHQSKYCSLINFHRIPKLNIFILFSFLWIYFLMNGWVGLGSIKVKGPTHPVT